jgi:hypothetical protein
MSSVTANNGYASPHQEWVNVMIEVERPSIKEADGVTRSERYKRLKANADMRRNELQSWIVRNGLADEVTAMGEATAFNLFFIRCTPHAAAELTHAPGVVSVMLADDHSLDAQAYIYA